MTNINLSIAKRTEEIYTTDMKGVLNIEMALRQAKREFKEENNKHED